MAGASPAREFIPIVFGGAWSEAETPSKVGATGLTACKNLVYRRAGSWGKRSGSGPAFAAAAPGPIANRPVSGIRWYRSMPTPLTQLVVAAQGTLWAGNDPNLAAPTALTQIANSITAQNPALPVSFASVYDPAVNNGNGGDILVMCGFTGPYNFATGAIAFAGVPVAGQTVTVTLSNGAPITTPAYTVLASDNIASIVAAVINLINTSAAVTPGTPYLGLATGIRGAAVKIGALASGAGGNAITYFATVTGAGLVCNPSMATSLTGGGISVSAPLKYDGTTVSGLSYQTQLDFILAGTPRNFTGCVSWHDHVWFWGDPLNPDTLYATDIDNPEGFSFMNTNGGYDIGRGDGDPVIHDCVAVGNILYVFKGKSIYAVTGYDFQQGEYEFQVQPAVKGSGVPGPGCVTRLNNALGYWDGSEFRRLAVGSFDPEPIGKTIPLTSGQVAQGSQAIIRATAGRFLVATHFNDTFAPVGPVTEQELLTNVMLFAVDVGNGVADTVLVYDDDSSQTIGNYAWAPWTGWTVAAWVSFGGGPTASGNTLDLPALYFIPPPGAGKLVVNRVGADAGADSGAAIPWLAQTGWIDLGTAALTKDLHRIQLDLEATPGAVIAARVIASGPVNGVAQTVYPPVNLEFPPTVGTAATESAQALLVGLKPALRGYKFLLTLTESSPESTYEVTGALADCVTNSFLP